MVILIIWLIWWALAFVPPVYVNASWLIPRKFAGFAIAPIVGYKHKRAVTEQRFKKHEEAHILQQRVLTPAIFFVIYFFEYAWNLAQGMNSFDAYYSIGFEKMARQAEKE